MSGHGGAAPLGRVERTPARPGPGPTPEALLRALDLTVGRRIRGLVPGEFRALDVGGGTELATIRPYQPGDDVRRMDWNVTARMITPHVRVFVPERALATWLLLDTSASMEFGTADRRKADVAEGVAIALGHVSTQRGNRLGVVTFGGASDRAISPAAGRAGLLAALVAPRGTGPGSARAEGRRTSRRGRAAGPVVDALRLVTYGAPVGGLVVLVSDFRGPRDWRRPLAEAATRHQLLAVEIRDPREDELTDVGELTLVDGETGREVRVDTSSATLRERFRAAAAAERADLAADLRRLGVRHVVLSTAGDWLFSFARQLRAGARAS
jgi:uncharacterized protein (DUF58 family)